jgi:uncharacterized protein DUF6541
MTWLQAMPTVLAGIAMVMAPGLLLTYLAGLRGIAAWGIAPALSASVFALVAVIAGVAGLGWSVLTVLLAIVVLAGLTMLIARFRASRVPADELGARLWALGGVVVAMALGAWVFHRSIVSADDLNQTWDAVFHYSALAAIQDTGNASSLHMSAAGMADVPNAFYPAAWHDGASLLVKLTGVSIPLAANVFSTVVALVIWPLGCVLLVRQLIGPNKAAIGAAGVLSIGFSAFPWGLVGFGVLWPNLLGLALVPAALAMIISIAGIGQQDVIGRTRAWVMLPFLLVGLVLAHPNALFGLLLIAAFPVAIAFVRWAVKQHRAGRTWVGVVAAVAILVGLYVVRNVLNHSSLAGANAFDWPAFEKPADGVGEMITNAPNGKAAAWLLSLLVIIGAVSCFRQRLRRWLVVGHVMFAGLYLASATLDGIWSLRLTGYWYNDSYRLAAMMPITAVPLAVFGVQATAAATRNRLTAWLGAERTTHATLPVLGTLVMLVLIVATGGLYLKDHTATTSAAYAGVGNAGNQSYVDRGKYALYSRIGREVPPGAVIAGDPYAGTAVIWALTGRKVLFAMPGPPMTPNYAYLGAHLKDAASDPKVCDLLTRYNVQYLVVAKNDVLEPKDDRRVAYAGLDYPAPGARFQLVDSEGQTRLYKITACDGPATR